MNSKMMALAAVLVVGVLAAAGVGYAYTATYTSDDEAVKPQFAVVTTLTAGEIDYDTNYNDKTGVTVTTVNGDDNFHVNIDASKMPKAGTLALTSYTVYFQDGTSWTGTEKTAGSTPAVDTTNITLSIPTDPVQSYVVGDENDITVTVAGTITSIAGNAATVCYIDHVELVFTATPSS